MDRFSLTEGQSEKIEVFCLDKPTEPGRTGGDGWLFVEVVLWIVRTGSSWRDLPPSFGHWTTVHKQFSYWVKAGVFQRMFDAVSGKPDMEYAMMDAMMVKVYWHGQGGKGDSKSGDRPFPRRPYD